MSRQESSSSKTRNAWFREATCGSIQSITKVLHECFPDLTADHITVAGVVGVAIGAVIAETQNRNTDNNLSRKIPTVLFLGAASILDAFDGAIARLRAKESSGADNSHGQLVDVIADRIQEATLATSRAVSANKRGDRAGELLAYVSEMSNVAPSLMRAISETRGVTVPEAGRNVIGFLGTRVGRSMTVIASTVFPEIRGIPTQKIIDILNITANALTTYDRTKTAFSEPETDNLLPSDKREEAEVRAKVLTGIAGATIISAIGTYVVLRNK